MQTGSFNVDIASSQGMKTLSNGIAEVGHIASSLTLVGGPGTARKPQVSLKCLACVCSRLRSQANISKVNDMCVTSVFPATRGSTFCSDGLLNTYSTDASFR